MNKPGRVFPSGCSETYLRLLLLLQLLVNQCESVASLCHDLQSTGQALQLSCAAALTWGNTV